jgi:hypothetical protein
VANQTLAEMLRGFQGFNSGATQGTGLSSDFGGDFASGISGGAGTGGSGLNDAFGTAFGVGGGAGGSGGGNPFGGGFLGGGNTNVEGFDLSKFLIGGDGQAGQLGTLFDIASGLGQGYLGLKEFGLAEDAFDFQKETTNKNFNANATAFNTAQNNRFRQNENARNQSTPNPFGTLDSFRAESNIPLTA